MRQTIIRFAWWLCLIVFIALPFFSSTELSPEEAVSYIETELSKKGLKNLKVTYKDIINSTKHNIFIEFGAEKRTTQEVVDIWYESALIIGGLQPIMNIGRGKEKIPTFKVNVLGFVKKGKLACWIHADYCARAIWDDSIHSSKEREQYILSYLHHER